MRSAKDWVSQASSALVGAFTQRNRNEPSGRSTYTSSRNNIRAAPAHPCARGIRASMHSKVDVEVIPGILPFTPSGPAFGCSKSLPAILSALSQIVGSV